MLVKDCKIVEIKARLELKLKTGEVLRKVNAAGEAGLKDTVVDIANDAIKGSPWLTGNNARSIQYTVDALSADIFSTSGYGGYLETGTFKMAPRPYFKPALDLHIGELPKNIKARLSRV